MGNPNILLNFVFIGPCIIVIVEEKKTSFISLAILFHFLCAQHVSDVNISGALDYSVELPHWPYCSWFDVCWSFGVVGLEWYPCCRLKPEVGCRVPTLRRYIFKALFFTVMKFRLIQ